MVYKYLFFVLLVFNLLIVIYFLIVKREVVKKTLRAWLQRCYSCCSNVRNTTAAASLPGTGDNSTTTFPATCRRLWSDCVSRCTVPSSCCKGWSWSVFFDGVKRRCCSFGGLRHAFRSRFQGRSSRGGEVSVESSSPQEDPAPRPSPRGFPGANVPEEHPTPPAWLSVYDQRDILSLSRAISSPLPKIQKLEESSSLAGDVSGKILSRSIKKEDLKQYLTHAVRPDVTIDKSFKTIPETFNKPMTIAALPANVHKNRYKNNLPYDETRVVLRRPPRDGCTDYINANYISSYRKSKAYIATQGPKANNDNTLGDFWSMVWENNTNIVVMICQLVENERVKVNQYWPDTLGQEVEYGDVGVILTMQEEELDYVKRCLVLSCDGQSREVMHYQFTGWPDHSAPKTAFTFTAMVKSVRQLKRTGTVVVHCSAGIGRTGTLLLVQVLLDHLEGSGTLNPIKTVLMLRVQRARLVENQPQYRFAHKVLLQYLFAVPTTYPVAGFPDQLRGIRDHLEKQYEEVTGFPRALTTKWGTSQDFSHMNRRQDVLPVDGRIVFLDIQQGLGSSQYVNAVRVDGLNHPDSYIVTEHPLACTFHRVWRLMYEKKVSVWLLLNTQQYDNQAYPPVLPPSGQGKTENLSIQIVNVNSHPFFTENFVVLDPIDSRSPMIHTMRVLQLLNWDLTKELPESPVPLLSLLEHLYFLRLSNPVSPVVITCSDGYTACGVAVALDLVLARLRLRQEVDIYQAVCGILYDRPQFISSLKQYIFLHDAVVAYLEFSDETKDRDAEEEDKKKRGFL